MDSSCLDRFYMDLPQWEKLTIYGEDIQVSLKTIFLHFYVALDLICYKKCQPVECVCALLQKKEKFFYIECFLGPCLMASLTNHVTDSINRSGHLSDRILNIDISYWSQL